MLSGKLGKGSQMAKRLGNVLYWAANATAIPLLLFSAIMGYTEYLHGTWGHYRSPLLLGIVGFGAWLLGRACRYVLAGR